MAIPKGFIPEQDTGFLFGEADARQDISFAAMSGLEQQFAAIILKDPAVQGVVGFAGATGGNASENTARMFIQLKPLDQRDSVRKVMARLRPAVAQVQGAKFYMQPGQDVTIGGRLEQAQYQYTLTDNNDAELNHWAPILLAAHAADEAADRYRVGSADRLAAPRARHRPRHRLAPRPLARR